MRLSVCVRSVCALLYAQMSVIPLLPAWVAAGLSEHYLSRLKSAVEHKLPDTAIAALAKQFVAQTLSNERTATLETQPTNGQAARSRMIQNALAAIAAHEP